MPVDPHRAGEVFLAAVELPADDRSDYMSVTCGDDVELRAEVERLLAAHAAPASMLEPPPPAATGAYVPGAGPVTGTFAETTEHILSPEGGTVIGERYTLQERIGEGGMGEVWVAKQTEPVKRRVALKLIKAGMDSRAVLTRFEQERQALALMDHPNIARVFDGGVTRAGRPFFVMELVNGLPLTRFCDEARLTPRQRLELFVPVCQAVQHAHQKGIVHRDLKPANILVTLIDGRPVPKVIDFGVAKATAGKLTEESLSTQFGAVVGTLEYMAPEQAGYSGDDVDTRADIYSLGVILYELLTGLRPIDTKRLKSAALTEMIRVIREDEPSRPSTRLSTDESLPSLAALRRTDPRKLTALLRGELDWVVMKCLEKSRDRRYETANGLARDVQRYLADEPVDARPPTAGYRFRKYLKRNKGPVTAGGLLTLTLVAGMVGTTWGLVRSLDAEATAVRERNDKETARLQAVAQAEEAERQKKLARAGFERARLAIDRAFTVVSENRLLQVQGLHPLRKDLLEEALRFYRALAAEWAGEPELRRDLVQAQFRVAAITSEIGSKTQALADYRHTIALCQEALRDSPDEKHITLTMATCHNNIGLLLMKQHQYPDSLAAFETSRGILEAFANRNGMSSSDRENERAFNSGNLALVLDALGRHREALDHLNAALAVRQNQVKTEPTNPDRHHELAGLLDTRAAILRHDRKFQEAADTFREAIAHELVAVNAVPTALDYQAFLGNHYFNLALVCENHLGRAAEALTARKEAVKVWEKLAADNPAVTAYREHVATGCVDIGNTLQYRLPKEGDPLPWYQRACTLLERLTKEVPEVGRIHSSFGATHDGIAYHQIETGQLEAALKSLNEAARHQRKAVELAPDVEQFHRFLSGHLMNRARVYTRLKQTDRVMEALEEAIPVLERVIRSAPQSPEKWRDLGSAHHTIGQILEAAGKTDEAFASHRRGIAVWQRQALARPDDEAALECLVDACRTLADELAKADRHSEAGTLREEEARFWRELKAKTKSPFRAMVAHAVACLARGELAVEAREWKTALTWFEQSRAEFRAAAAHRPDDLDVANLTGRVLKWIGDVHFVLEEPAKAEPAWTEALSVYRTRLLPREPNHPGRNATIGGLLHNLGRIQSDAGNHTKALECFRDAVRHQKIAYAKTPEPAREWLNNHYVLLATTLRELQMPEEAAAAVRERIKLWPKDGGQHARAAGELAQCVPLLKQNEKRSREQGDESVALLGRAVQLGFGDAARLKKEPAFDAIRGREDFKKLIAGLEEKQPKP